MSVPLLGCGRGSGTGTGGGGGGGGGPPPGVTNLILWVDASVASSFTFSSGSSISTIADLSGAGNNLSAVHGNSLYSATGFNTSYPAIVFDVVGVAGAFQKTSFGMGTGNTLTCWYVGTHSGTANGGTNFSRAISYAKPANNDFDNVGSWTIARKALGTTQVQFARNSTGSDANCTVTSPQRIIVTVDSSGIPTIYVNGSATTGTTVAGNWVSAGTMMIGSSAQQAGTGSDWDGPIAELGVSTDFMNSTDVATLDSFLQTKWGL